MPTLPLHSVAAIAWVPVYLFLAFYYLIFYMRDRVEKRHLLFSFLCLSLAHYSVGAAGMYASGSFSTALEWQRFQLIGAIFGFPTIALFSMAIADYRIRPRTYVIFYGAALLLAAGDLFTDWFFTPNVMERDIEFIGIKISYLDAEPGWLGFLFFFVGITLTGHGLYFTYYAVRNKVVGSLTVLLGLVFLIGCAINDIFVASGIYDFVYLTEHGFVVYAFSVAYLLQDQHMALQRERRMERKRLKVLNDLIGVLNKTSSLEEALAAMSERFFKALGWDWLGLFLMNGEDRLELAAQRGTTRVFHSEKSFDIKKVTMSDVLKSGIMSLGRKRKKSLDVSGRFISRWLRARLSQKGLEPTLLLPLSVGDDMIGVLVGASAGRLSVTSEHMALLEHISDDLAMAAVKLKLITDLESRTRELEKVNEELKSLDAMKSDLLANVSHELKTPLVSIKGYAEMMLSRKLGELSPRQEKGLMSCSRNAGRLLHMIQDLLDYARLKDGRMELDETRLDLREILEESIEAIMPRAEGVGIEIKKNVDEFGPLWVRGDRVRLIQVFDNLLSNAVKFNVKGGWISIEAEYLKNHEAEQPGELVGVTVGDSGVGIPKEQLRLVFDRFYRVKGGLSAKTGGTGIGLAIVKELVELHRGSVEVESVVGRGTRFTVKLPAAPATD